MDAQQNLPIKRISIFKNGTALFIKEGRLSVKDGVVMLPIPAQALFGTYWIGATKDNSVKNLVFRNDKIKKEEKAKELWQYLAGNIGATVTISLATVDHIANTVTGKIVSFEQETRTVRLKQLNGKNTLLHTNEIYQLDFVEDERNVYLEDSVQRMIILKPEKAADNIGLQEIYLQTGINWIPSYLLKYKDDKSARLEMKATIENGTDEIVEAETELVVGSPQMYFGLKHDPMTYDYMTVEGNNSNAFSSQPSQMLSNASFARSASADQDGGFNNEFSTAGEKNNDLYLYKIGKLSLPKQGKGNFSIFAAPVEYKDKYEAILNDKTDYYNSRYIDPTEKDIDVFHSIEIKNTSSVPLTTAPVMVVNEKEQFLAQDLLKYTPVGGDVSIKLSKAIDVVLKNAEEETSRVEEAKRISSTMYSKVVIKGVITINNLQAKEVLLVVKKTIRGSVLSQSDNAKVTNNPYQDVNRSAEIKWEIKLQTNTKKILTYEYEVFYPR